VIPVLRYPDPSIAAEWLGKAFGFTVRLPVGNHRIQCSPVKAGSLSARATFVPNHSIIVRDRWAPGF
jgi:hypothetical protein